MGGADALEIGAADVTSDEVQAVVAQHLDFARRHTAPEGVFALDGNGLRHPSVTVFGARGDGRLVAIGALRQLDPAHGELKSMHTLAEVRGQGVGRAMVTYLLDQASARGYMRVSLETGAGEAFAPARALYARTGFVECGPFGDYPDTPASVFMTRTLG
jgi:putative acetyltransferase